MSHKSSYFQSTFIRKRNWIAGNSSALQPSRQRYNKIKWVEINSVNSVSKQEANFSEGNVNPLKQLTKAVMGSSALYIFQ